MSRTSLLLAFVCLLALGAGSAFAATADFQCNCTFGGFPISCVCDADRQSSFGPGTSCGGATPTTYFWDMGDGTSFFNGAYIGHSYSSPICEGTYPRMTVFCSDGSNATRQSCICSYVGVNGCIRPGSGWTP